MAARNHRDAWMREMEARQRNIVFPDTVRNAGGFWRGLRDGQLNRAQWTGLFVLFFFYVFIFVALLYAQWPEGPGRLWAELLYGYGPYFLLSLPVIVFVLLIGRLARRLK
jgi:hypothetical protein